MNLEQRILKLEGTSAALVDMISNKQTDSVDGEKLNQFITNYGLIGSIVNNETVDVFLSNITLVEGRFAQVSSRLDGLLAAAEAESDKLVSQLGGGASGLALNVVDSALFRASVGDAYGSMLNHLSELDITGKINSMDSSLSEALGLIDEMKTQKTQIAVLLQKIADNKALLENMEDVNNDQTTLIATSQNLIDPWQADIIKRVLRTKEGDAPELDYLKIIDVCHEIIRQIEGGNGRWNKGYGMGATCEH